MNLSAPSLSFAICSALVLFSCTQRTQGAAHSEAPETRTTTVSSEGSDTIVFGAGCFWCCEAVFKELKGVQSVMPGYAGGTTTDPDYESVSTGMTGHAETARIIYDPALITTDELLEVFWQTHDPTTLNRQGADEGTQYRSAIFYTTAEQKAKAEHYKAELEKQGAFKNPIVTEIAPLKKFYLAENYHRDYYAKNPEQGYCRMVIQPKLEKFRKAFANKLK